MNQIILLYNKEKLEEFKPLFKKLENEIGCTLKSNYFKIGSNIRIKEVTTQLERELNHILAEIHYETPNKVVLFPFNL